MRIWKLMHAGGAGPRAVRSLALNLSGPNPRQMQIMLKTTDVRVALRVRTCGTQWRSQPIGASAPLADGRRALQR